MYSRKESADAQKAFWTAFGQYMKPVPQAGWDKVNWSNYKTGLKNLHFRLDAGRGLATVSIEMTGSATRELLFHTFTLLKNDFEEVAGIGWVWEEQARDEQGNPYCRIYRQLDGVDLMKQSDWPDMISFFKENMIRLDAFWFANRDFFEAALNSR